MNFDTSVKIITIATPVIVAVVAFLGNCRIESIKTETEELRILPPSRPTRGTLLHFAWLPIEGVVPDLQVGSAVQLLAVRQDLGGQQ